MELTQYEKDNAASILAVVNDYIVSMQKTRKLAEENEWDSLMIELDDKLAGMEKRAKQLMKAVISCE